MSMRRYIAALFVLMTIFVLNTYAQTSASDGSTPAALAKGVQPLGAYSGSDFDNINLYNGNVNFSLPLAILNGRAGQTAGISLNYNSKFWRLKEIPVDEDLYFVPVTDDVDPYGPNLGLGWALTAGRMVQRTVQYSANGSGYRVGRFIFTAPDGTEYEFRDDNSNGAPLVSGSRGTMFHSSDGSAASFQSSAPVTDPTFAGAPPVLKANGTVVLKDGTRYTIVEGKVTKQQDKNGNIIQYEYSPDGSRLKKIIDNIGRTILIDYTYNSSTADIPVTITVTVDGVAGVDRTTTISFGKLANLLADGESLKTRGQLYDPVIYDSFSGLEDNTFNPKLISSVKLPSGHTWEFRYNSYGEIAYVKTPSGGEVEYNHVMVNTAVQQLQGGPQIFRRVHKRLQNPNTAGQPILETTYSDPTLRDGSGNLMPVLMVQKDRTTQQVLAAQKHYFASSPLDNYGGNLNNAQGPYGAFVLTGYTPWMDGKEIRVETLDFNLSTIKYIIIKKYEQFQPVSWATSSLTELNQPENNPRVTIVTKILREPSQDFITKITYTYDQYNNVTSEKVYDHAAVGVGTNPASVQGTLLKEKTFTYYNGNSYQTDFNVHLRALVETESTGKGTQVETTTKYEYDNYIGGITSRSFSIAGTRNSTYDSPAYIKRGNVTKVTSGFGSSSAKTITFNYDTGGNVTTRNGPRAGQVINLSYDAASQFTFLTSSSQTVDGIQFISSTTFDFSTGLVLTSTNINGEVTTYSYNDPLSRLTSVSRTGLGSASITYSLPSESLYVESELQVQLNNSGQEIITSRTNYDGFANPISQDSEDVLPAGKTTIKINYDALERVIATSNPYRPGGKDNTGWTHKSYDALSRVISIKSYADEAGSTGYTGEVKTAYFGPYTIVEDEAGKKGKSLTDALGRVITVYEPSDTSTEPTIETSYEYDARGNLKKVIQGTQQRIFNYDELSRLTSFTLPESGITSFTYDASSNVLTKVDARNITTTSTYDLLNRVVSVQYTNSPVPTPNVSYYYDDGAGVPNVPGGFNFDETKCKGRLTAVVTSAIAGQGATGVYYNYGVAGRVINTSQLLDGTHYTLAATYNQIDNLLSVTYPSQVNVINTYNAIGQLESVVRSNRLIASNISYLAAGEFNQQKLGNQLYHKIGYNNRIQPISISLGTTEGGTDKLGLTHKYGILSSADTQNPTIDETKNNGNISQITITPGAGTTAMVQNFTYDNLNRIKLAKEFHSQTVSWSQTFSYDRYGNRTCCTPMPGNTPGSGIDISTNNNRITENGFIYDAAGNLTQEGTGKVYEYDANNKIAKSTINGSVVGQYYYDGLGRRVKKVTGNLTTRFIYSGSGNLIAEYENGAAVASPTREYVYGATGLLLIVEASCSGKVLKYVTTDNLGSTRLISDYKGRVMSRHDYFPFGEEITSNLGSRSSSLGYQSLGGIRQRFTGYERDEETGLDFAQARYFSSSFGRFNSPDPLNSSGTVINPQSWNRYSYVGNRPLVYTDPSGLLWYYSASQNKYKWFDSNPGEGWHLVPTGQVYQSIYGQVRLKDNGDWEVIPQELPRVDVGPQIIGAYLYTASLGAGIGASVARGTIALAEMLGISLSYAEQIVTSIHESGEEGAQEQGQVQGSIKPLSDVKADRLERELRNPDKKHTSVTVESIPQARYLIDRNFPELIPADKGGAMPHPDADGTYRGDLRPAYKVDSKGNATEQPYVHAPGSNETHHDAAHYNLNLRGGKKADIVIRPRVPRK